MRDWWTPDAAFLSALRQEQVAFVAEECGAAEELQGFAKRSKKDMVEQLTRYFMAETNPNNEKAAAWLPGFFRFPARKHLNAGNET